MWNKIYISVPISTDWDIVRSYSRKLESQGYNVKVWNRSERYNQNEFDESDSVLFILPKNKFKADSNYLPIGLRSELARAYAQNKKIYVGYKTSNDEFNIYNTETNGMYINAISGTANKIFECNTNEVSQKTLDRLTDKIMVNSRYGIAGNVGNPCLEIELPKGPTGFSGRPGIAGVDGIEFDERLLLMI
jgi:hypothetical protein